jgi:hypothetical protein
MNHRLSDPRRPETTVQTAWPSETSLREAMDYGIRIPVAVPALAWEAALLVAR